MNKVQNFFNKIPDDKLKQAFEDIIDMNNTGVMKDGEFRNIQRAYKELVNIREYSFSDLVKEITYRVAVKTYKHL